MKNLLVFFLSLILLSACQNQNEDWGSYGKDLTNQRYSKLNQINIKNVNNLELAWQYQTGIRATFQATPLVYKGIMYVSLPFNNVIALDGGITHTASVAFVTQSSTLDGTATAAGSSSVSNGDTSQHDGTDTSASNLVNDDSSADGSSTDDSSNGDTNNNGNSGINSESESSNIWLIVGSSIVILGIVIVVLIMTFRSKNSGDVSNFNQQLWGNESQIVPQAPAMGVSQVMPETIQQTHHVAQVPTSQIMTAPPPPAQPTIVSDYSGLPPGGQYDQSTGQTIYILPDGTRWQMMSDGSFTKL